MRNHNLHTDLTKQIRWLHRFNRLGVTRWIFVTGPLRQDFYQNLKRLLSVDTIHDSEIKCITKWYGKTLQYDDKLKQDDETNMSAQGKNDILSRVVNLEQKGYWLFLVFKSTATPESQGCWLQWFTFEKLMSINQNKGLKHLNSCISWVLKGVHFILSGEVNYVHLYQLSCQAKQSIQLNEWCLSIWWSQNHV